MAKKVKVLHKYWKDYTNKEIEKIKDKHCKGCKHFGHDGVCNYSINTDIIRGCRPEICPYNTKKGGHDMDQITHEKFVMFDVYCKTCKNKDLKENDEPCCECLSHPTNYESHKPVNYVKNEGAK